MNLRTVGALVFALFIFQLPAEAAQPAYFQGKTVTLQVGAPAGGRQDRIARTLAKYLTKYTPGNPVFLIQNKPADRAFQRCWR
jgi:tripartite-type tricarboxylate transporter receptor subunit TctC